MCRLFVYVLQHQFLFVVRKVLISSPSLLDVFRSAGVWNFIFSKSYFYSGLVSADCAASFNAYIGILPWTCNSNSNANFTDLQVNKNAIETLQIKVFSLLEFAATLTGNAHNEVGTSVFSSCFDVYNFIFFIFECFFFVALQEMDYIKYVNIIQYC